MSSYLKIDGTCDFDEYPRIGGACALPENIPWPKDKANSPCILLFSADSTWVTTHSKHPLPEGLLLSIFVPFDPGSSDHAVAMARAPNSARALVHSKAVTYRQESQFSLDPPRKVIIDEDDVITPEDEFDTDVEPKIGGVPTWLQRRIDIPGRRFVMQLMAHQIRAHWPKHSSLFMGGVGYLFLDIEWDQTYPEAGEFRLQYT